MLHKKRPFAMGLRVARLLLTASGRNALLVTSSYDRISGGYNEAWTHHMRHLTDELIDRLELHPGQLALDLTCGTGYATRCVAARTGGRVIGVDASEGMLAQARADCPEPCEFIQADILDYLKSVPPDSFDRVTCCWGLGYSKPLGVLRHVRRVLKPGGRVGIIDNGLFSLREVLWASILTFMEQPGKLENVMTFRFLAGRRQLGLWYRLARLRPACGWGGEQRYMVASGEEAIARLRATGAAAGFEYAANECDAGEVFTRFAEILEQRYGKNGAIPIVHRYLAGIAVK
ncbi:MAG: methyltransferase domain-containing protein [Thermoguttaceae bacterium]|jgi:SAM-dependent methyltransferase|nr:methyltransferase domain-containing protein [Thermoguttaceae bacterium]